MHIAVVLKMSVPTDVLVLFLKMMKQVLGPRGAPPKNGMLDVQLWVQRGHNDVMMS